MKIPSRDEICKEHSGRELVYLDIDKFVNAQTQTIQLK